MMQKTLKKLVMASALLTSELALIGSIGGMAASQNTYAKIYNGVDFTTLALTEKSIKEHVYEKGKEYIHDKAHGLNNSH